VIRKWGAGIVELKVSPKKPKEALPKCVSGDDVCAYLSALHVLGYVDIPVCHLYERVQIPISDQRAIMISKYPSGIFEMVIMSPLLVQEFPVISTPREQLALWNAMQTIASRLE
jgi:hypothetical protein